MLGPVAVIALALAAFGWLSLRGVAPVVTWLDVGSPADDLFITGAFPPERNAAESYRWTTPSATLRVPIPANGRYRLDFAIAAVGDQPRQLRLTCPGGEATTTIAAGQTPPVVTLDCQASDDIAVALSVPETRIPGDGRPLGIAVRDVRVTALDTETSSLWRLRASLLAAAAIVGLGCALLALFGRRIAVGVSLAALVVALAFSLLRPEWIGPATSGPSGLIALAAGYATCFLCGSRRTAPLVLGIIALLSMVVVPQPDLVLLLPALWTPHDNAAWHLLPFLAASSIVLAALLGGRRAPLIAGAATSISIGGMLAPILVRPLLVRWSLVLNGPDWNDVASPLGAALLVATAMVVLLACFAVSATTLMPRVGLALVVIFALAILVPWRNVVMDLNGDEPHYYVTAHSIAADADLELLDDYLEPDYFDHTISPTGNIAVDRDTDPDRYAAFAPQPDGSHYMFPDPSSGLRGIEPRGLPVETRNQFTLVDDTSNRDILPPLTPGQSLAISLSGPCAIDALWLASISNEPASATVQLLDTFGEVTWQETDQLTEAAMSVHPSLDASVCLPDTGQTLVITADQDIIALAIDRASGLRIIPARTATENWLLGPLPRDRYATQEATARLALHNPGTSVIDATITLLTPHQSLIRASRSTIPPGATIITDLDFQNASAVAIDATAPLVASASGWLPGGSYVLPSMSSVADWSLTIDAAPDRDAGIWLSVANPTGDPRALTITDGDVSDLLTICGYCADTVHLPAGRSDRQVSMSTGDGPLFVAALAYEERTGSLHFDLGLPVLAALPVRIAGTEAAPVVSALATLLLAIGLAELLAIVGVSPRTAAFAAIAVALLAPLSPYAVRLYTEPLAACLIVWSLLCWNRSRERPALALGALALASTLPLVHGRYLPVAVVLMLLAATAGLRGARASRRQQLVLAGLAIAVVGIVAVSPLAVALRDRASASYFSTEWVPHNLLGILLDRGSGLIPFAPWCLLAFAARRPFHPFQRAAIVLFVTQLSVVALRAGGWQTFGAPARYILPVVPLLALLAVPGAIRLWRTRAGQVAVFACLGWSAVATILLHWLPLSGYVAEGRYFINDARRELPLLALFDAAPTVTPTASSNLVGLLLFGAILVATVRSVLYSRA